MKWYTFYTHAVAPAIIKIKVLANNESDARFYIRDIQVDDIDLWTPDVEDENFVSTEEMNA